MSDEDARLGWFRWSLIGCPLVVGAVLAGYGCGDAYLDGRHFVQAMHVFGWFLWWGFSALVLVVPVIVALIMSCLTPKGPEGQRSKAWRLFLAGVSVPIVGLALMPVFFNLGRWGAYRSLDLAQLVESCRQVRPIATSQETNPPGRGRSIGKGDPEFAALPVFIRDLHPIFVWHGEGLVVIQMDGGGVMYHEGLVIAPNMPADAFRRRSEAAYLSVVRSGYSVCRYRVDDWRGVPEVLNKQK